MEVKMEKREVEGMKKIKAMEAKLKAMVIVVAEVTVKGMEHEEEVMVDVVVEIVDQ